MEYKNLNNFNYSAFYIVRKYDNEQLRSLLNETKKIGKNNAPKYSKQSLLMKQLFEAENVHNTTWSDQFSNVQSAIHVEILRRVSENIW